MRYRHTIVIERDSWSMATAVQVVESWVNSHRGGLVTGFTERSAGAKPVEIRSVKCEQLPEEPERDEKARA